MFNADAEGYLLHSSTFSNPEFISKVPVPIVVFLDGMGMVVLFQNLFGFYSYPKGKLLLLLLLFPLTFGGGGGGGCIDVMILLLIAVTQNGKEFSKTNRFAWQNFNRIQIGKISFSI